MFFQEQTPVGTSTYTYTDDFGQIVLTHIEKNILTYSIFCNYFSIGVKNIAPATSSKFNESSESNLSYQVSFRDIICQILYV